mmetsp:Transcript_65846/g.186972  ORF Transcript_65846/g.186972 Transcript_65846/m.186972 type:complete len:484 (+) Transcript_65846:55-1506(+)
MSNEADLVKEAAIANFAQRFPIDEKAKDRLRQLPDDALQRVFEDFRPPADSNPDFSRRLVGFLKGFSHASPGGQGGSWSQPFASFAGGGGGALALTSQDNSVPMEELEHFRSSYPVDARAFDYLKIVPPEVQRRVVSTFKPPGVQPDYSKIVTAHIKFCLTKHREEGGQAHRAPAGAAPGLLQSLGGLASMASLAGLSPEQLVGQLSEVTAAGDALPQEQLQLFRSSYPMDERAFEYLAMAPPDVQQRAISTFRPPGVQPDYSKIVTAHVKFCLMQQKEQPQAPAGSTVSSAMLNLKAAAAITRPLAGSSSNVSGEELELFRSMYPMDERAFDYLSGSPPEVQERVIDTFNVAEVQSDYSKAITAHVKFCLRQHKEQVPGQIALPAGTDAQQAVQMLTEFHQKYPTDERAWNYLLQSSAEVKQRVLTEFCPPQGVEGDYSKAVTAYIRRCRDDEKARGGQGQWEEEDPGAKRPRTDAGYQWGA